MKHILAILMICSLFSVCAQSYQFYEVPQIIPQRYRIDVASEKQRIIDKSYPGARKHEVLRFAEHNLYAKQLLLTEGYIYMRLDIEQYLTSILKTLLPDSLKSNKVQAYLAADEQDNAFSIFDGTVIVNIGCIDNLRNESGLAFVLAHELAHSIFRDAEAIFYQEVKAERDETQTYEEYKGKVLANAAYSRAQERRADSVAFLLTKNAGYNVQEGVKDFAGMLIVEEKYKAWVDREKHLSQTQEGGKTSYEKEALLFATHPETVDRIQFLTQWSKRNEAQQLAHQANSAQFEQLKLMAQNERLKLMLDSYNFQSCMESAFANFLTNPHDSIAVYYVLEALRQDMYRDSLHANETFIAWQYSDMNSQLSIMQQLDKLFRDSSYAQTIAKQQIIPQNLPFKTENEVFLYFAQLAQEKKMRSCYLPIALYYNAVDNTKRNSLLDAYLQWNDAEFTDFAQALRNNQLRTSQGTNITLVSDIFTIENHDYGKRYNYTKSQQQSQRFFPLMTEYLKPITNTQFVAVSSVKSQNFRQYCQYQDILSCVQYNCSIKQEEHKANDVIYFDQSAGASSDSSKKFDIFIMRPDFWCALHRNNISSFNYIDMLHYQDANIIGGFHKLVFPVTSSLGLYHPYNYSYKNYGRHLIESNCYSFSINQKTQAPVDYRSYFNPVSKATYINTVYQYVTRK